ncbi:type II toxin-antitoxin system RelE/ParE family toxin [Helicobacter bizzozeronii]|uniref:type II toxin-antitoxin system RelE/ParE family toxin n=1 Tax=Helicobacter bizzozeronii TaxID=56877 RepID=UPI00244D9299|nr:type II toxin-antitoxin system RelE/ParE family toxin [Helicobacter bizzozeronii]GMB92712.1 type II toxin-antitoxin system RelE/ParE family toxin [Helicobacter bizzozeronii]
MEIQTSNEFEKWLARLKDDKGYVAITRRIDILRESGHFGDYKHITGVIFELRIHIGPGYRLYIAKRGGALVILLCGGDKSTQQKDIIKAQRILEEEF